MEIEIAHLMAKQYNLARGAVENADERSSTAKAPSRQE
jgi:hypothetical protein